ncbi:unnamed protein product [Phytomonas sp. Hart1]|nr:unnamed protein product [Phytomonas sp. Hart1]|eukprot:CCW68757.1 unnamed protein product [Phytomonas sp. isolate Hart1]
MQKRQRYANIIEEENQDLVEVPMGSAPAEKSAAALSQDMPHSKPESVRASSSGRSKNASRQRFLESRRATAQQNYGSLSEGPDAVA